MTLQNQRGTIIPYCTLFLCDIRLPNEEIKFRYIQVVLNRKHCPDEEIHRYLNILICASLMLLQFCINLIIPQPTKTLSGQL